MFELEHTFDPQSDRVWAKKKASVPPRLVSKHPAKIMVWRAMSAQALTNLHMVPQKQSFDAGYYVTEIVQKSLLPSLAWNTSTSSVLTMKIVPGMSLPIFQQDGAPARTSRESQQWCQENVKGFWD